VVAVPTVNWEKAQAVWRQGCAVVGESGSSLFWVEWRYRPKAPLGEPGLWKTKLEGASSPVSGWDKQVTRTFIVKP
jgi:hypothetical protein